MEMFGGVQGQNQTRQGTGSTQMLEFGLEDSEVLQKYKM